LNSSPDPQADPQPTRRSAAPSSPAPNAPADAQQRLAPKRQPGFEAPLPPNLPPKLPPNVPPNLLPNPLPISAGLAPAARRLLRLAVAALARREHSRVEIERKLQRRLLPEESQDDLVQALERLQARGLLSDRRMAEALVRARATRYGRLRIAQELDRRGVDRQTIAATLPPADDEDALAMALWQRKFGRAPASMQERARQIRFLAARGFSAATIGRVLSTTIDAD